MLHSSGDKLADVIVAEPQDTETIFGILTLAFATDPPNRWMYPDPAQYLRHFPEFARALGGAALTQGTAFVNRERSGAALWLAPDVGPDEPALMRLIEETVAADKREILAAVIDEMVRHHPQEPHWYLPFIGVEPAHQGKGLGALLLQPILAACDAKGLPAYLESSNPKNQTFYERHGFKALGEIRFGSCPPVVPMLRRAKQLA
jgi:GNAT superfamily N-acetyltransferase